MNNLMRILIFAFLSLYSLSATETLNYGVALTTIPPRFKVLHHQLTSWLNQTILPLQIKIFVPKKYKRFRSIRVGGTSSYQSRDQLLEVLLQNPTIAPSIHSKLITVHELEKDYGPLTKFVGVLTEPTYNHLLDPVVDPVKDPVVDPVVDFWLFCDDDVVYLPKLAQHYQTYVHSYSSTQRQSSQSKRSSDVHNAALSLERVGFTMFTAEQRLRLALPLSTLESSASSSILHSVPHIQGVDSYIVPSATLVSSTWSRQPYSLASAGAAIQLETSGLFPSMNASRTMRVIDLLHTEWCPESFYQDDYIVSLLLYLSGVSMYSARLAHPACTQDDGEHSVDMQGIDCHNAISLTQCVEGVSKNLFQMHMKEEVFMRESITQDCLTARAADILNILHAL